MEGVFRSFTYITVLTPHCKSTLLQIKRLHSTIIYYYESIIRKILLKLLKVECRTFTFYLYFLYSSNTFTVCLDTLMKHETPGLKEPDQFELFNPCWWQ